MPTAPANDLVMRYQLASYMKCMLGAGDKPDGKFRLIGEGFTSFQESKNPQEYTRKYINYQTEKSDVIGYSPSIEYSCDCINGDPVVQEIVAITDGELVGNATHRQVVNVNLWEKGEDGKCPAVMREYAIIPGGKADGTEALIYTGTFKAAGDITTGKFDPTTCEFTADDAE